MNRIELKLVDLYNQMYQHTNRECANTCEKPHSCCDKMYCDWAKQHAKKHWNIDLQETEEYKAGKTKYPYMSEKGCTVAPHLRISCTLHTCAIYKYGFKPGDATWTQKYFDIRNQIEYFEMEKYENQKMKWKGVTTFIDSQYKGMVTLKYKTKILIKSVTARDAYIQCMLLYHEKPSVYNLDEFEFEEEK